MWTHRCSQWLCPERSQLTVREGVRENFRWWLGMHGAEIAMDASVCFNTTRFPPPHTHSSQTGPKLTVFVSKSKDPAMGVQVEETRRQPCMYLRVRGILASDSETTLAVKGKASK